MRLSPGGVVCPTGPGSPPTLKASSRLGDYIHWGKSQRADNFLIAIYQIDCPCRRLLWWVGALKLTLRRGLAALGEPVVKGLRFVCTDMWRPYLNVSTAKAGQALPVLDRFHITAHLNQCRGRSPPRRKSGRLRGRPLAEKLKKMRWKLLRKAGRVRGRARCRLCGLLQSKLATGRAWMLKETSSATSGATAR